MATCQSPQGPSEEGFSGITALCPCHGGSRGLATAPKQLFPPAPCRQHGAVASWSTAAPMQTWYWPQNFINPYSSVNPNKFPSLLRQGGALQTEACCTLWSCCLGNVVVLIFWIYEYSPAPPVDVLLSDTGRRGALDTAVSLLLPAFHRTRRQRFPSRKQTTGLFTTEQRLSQNIGLQYCSLWAPDWFSLLKLKSLCVTKSNSQGWKFSCNYSLTVEQE